MKLSKLIKTLQECLADGDANVKVAVGDEMKDILVVNHLRDVRSVKDRNMDEVVLGDHEYAKSITGGGV
mgnify:CR=1 FL=1